MSTSPKALMTDLYQLTMAAGYFRHGLQDKRVSFELFVRKLPDHRRYLLFAGLQSVIEYLRNVRFSESQIAYLAEVPALRSAMSFDLVEYLRDFRFRGDVWAMPEGTVVFEREPMIRITGTLLETQLVETFLLSTINTETTVATKASRIVRAAGGGTVLEFGTRRTSPEEAVASARAAFLAGFSATSNVEAGYRYDIPVAGTAAHSWTMSHASEEEAFRHYVEAFPNQATLLVDTYDTLEGVRRAIAVAGDKLKGVRLDSGDLLELSKGSRKLLDEAGLKDTEIIASGDLNEFKIAALREAGAPIDGWGVGTELVRSRDNPTLGGVYKMVYDHTEDRPVAKFSVDKETLPGLHQVFRLERDGLAAHDVLGTLPEFHVDAKPLLVEWMKDGKLTRELPSLAGLRKHARAQLAALPERVCSFEPWSAEEAYEVRVSDGLTALIEEVRHREMD
ncbi:MAG: nicotinate phosphoribosyltransferase [Deltaproteobacteria bacterium]